MDIQYNNHLDFLLLCKNLAWKKKIYIVSADQLHLLEGKHKLETLAQF